MKSISKTLSSALVPGDEPLNMKTPKMEMSLSKASAKTLSDKNFGEGRGQFSLPDWCKLKEECDPDDIVSLEVRIYYVHIYECLCNSNLNFVIMLYLDISLRVSML